MIMHCWGSVHLCEHNECADTMSEFVWEQVDILCTHPMFGPDSGKGSWRDLNLMYEVVRVGSGSTRQQRLDCFLKAWPSPSLPLATGLVVFTCLSLPAAL